ncbi:MAG: diadenylate cyclase CdaA [Bacteroidales bacterium]|nr:diadenylate cyclase CdaA [Bacteroidales bacterium]
MFHLIDIRIVDIIDVLIGAYIMYAVYKLVKGTVAMNIIISIIAFMATWFIVKQLKMNMLSVIFDSFMNVGLLALIIIFQQEVRQFLVMLGSRYDFLRRNFLSKVMNESEAPQQLLYVNAVSKACENMSRTHTGALIVFTRNATLNEIKSTGEEINAAFSQQLIETIFFKNTPLHDGAMIVDKNHILAAGCILPVSHNMDIPKQFGLRHRSALGITEETDAVAVVVSEETGNITVFQGGQYTMINSAIELGEYLEKI